MTFGSLRPTIALLLFAALQAQAQAPPQSTAPIYGSIAGRVMCEDGPLAFASVTVTAAGINRNRGNASRTVLTDAEGKFKVDGLRAAALLVSAEAPGYVQQRETSTSADPDLLVEPSQPTYYHIGEEVLIQMVRGGVITGRLRTADGEPAIGLRVSAQPASADLELPDSAHSEARTDDRGIYRLFGLPAGTYYVSASAAAAGGPGGFGGRGGQARNPFANDAPVYFPSGSRAAATEVAVAAGQETSGIDIQYRRTHGASISGTVAGAATDPAGRGGGGFVAEVTLAQKGSGQTVSTGFTMPRGRGGAQGGFALFGVPDGEYELTARRGLGSEVSASAPVRVVVNGADVSGLTLTLKPMASVRAKLQVEAGAQCTAARPASMEEQVFALHLDPAKESFDPPTGAPDRGGEMLFRGLAPGRYRLVAQSLDERWYLRAVAAPLPAPNAPAKPGAPAPLVDAGRAGLTLAAGERRTGVLLSAAEGAASLGGKISKAAPQWRVHLVPVERERADDPLRYAETRTGNGGAFRLRNLAPGKYWVLALPPPRTEPANGESPAAWDAAARLRLRRAAEAANTLVEFQPCQRLTGYALSGKP